MQFNGDTPKWVRARFTAGVIRVLPDGHFYKKSLIMSHQTMAALFIDALRATDLTTFEFLRLPAKGDVAFDFVGGLLSKFEISIILMGYKLCILWPLGWTQRE